jgi:hypothetical protein
MNEETKFIVDHDIEFLFTMSECGNTICITTKCASSLEVYDMHYIDKNELIIKINNGIFGCRIISYQEACKIFAIIESLNDPLAAAIGSLKI